MTESIGRLARAIGYAFADESLVETALTHRSAGSVNYERLEFLGDAILGAVIAEALFRKFPESNEGQLSRLRAKLVKRDSIAEIARGLRLGEYLQLGPGELRSGGKQRGSILADAFEAVLGAICIDGGYGAARTVILRLFEAQLGGLSVASHQKDPKTRLQELLQARGEPLPEYRITGVEGEQHDQIFTVSCRLAERDLSATAAGSSRRKAEQAAARRILEQIQ